MKSDDRRISLADVSQTFRGCAFRQIGGELIAVDRSGGERRNASQGGRGMSARTDAGGSAKETGLGRASFREELFRRLWIILLVVVFLGALGGSYAVMRGRLERGARSAPIPTAEVAAPSKPSTAGAAIVPVVSTPASSAVGTQATPSTDQAAAWYLYQQSHEQDFCSCGNGTSSPSSP